MVWLVRYVRRWTLDVWWILFQMNRILSSGIKKVQNQNVIDFVDMAITNLIGFIYE